MTQLMWLQSQLFLMEIGEANDWTIDLWHHLWELAKEKKTLRMWTEALKAWEV
jgi:hypothetical protein